MKVPYRAPLGWYWVKTLVIHRLPPDQHGQIGYFQCGYEWSLYRKKDPQP